MLRRAGLLVLCMLVASCSTEIRGGIEDIVTFPGGVATRAPTENAYSLIREFEGWRAKAYNDPVGHCTIGYGHLISLGPCSESDIPRQYEIGLTRRQGEVLMQEDAARAAASIRRLVKSPLSQSQYNALVDFVFNFGETKFARSTLLRSLNAGDFDDAAYQIGRWVYADGQVLNGLVRRRNAEIDLFTSRSKILVIGLVPPSGVSADDAIFVDPDDYIDVTLGEFE